MKEIFDSVVIYSSWLEVARKKLSEEKVCQLMVQLMEYGLYGKVPNNSDDDVMDTIFEMARPNIDSNIKKKIDGRKGGRKPSVKSGNKNAEKDQKTSGLSNANGNGNVNANANGNGNDNGVPSADASAFGAAEGTASEPEWMKR